MLEKFHERSDVPAPEVDSFTAALSVVATGTAPLDYQWSSSADGVASLHITGSSVYPLFIFGDTGAPVHLLHKDR